MEDSKFWRLIGVLSQSAGERAVGRLIESLATLPKEEIQGFDDNLWNKIRQVQRGRAFREKFAEGSESSDEALFVALAIIARGPVAFDNALMGDVEFDEYLIGGADLLAYAATDALQRSTGELLIPDSVENEPLPDHLPWIDVQFGDSELRPRVLWEPIFHYYASRMAKREVWQERRANWDIEELLILLQYRIKAPNEHIRVGRRGRIVHTYVLRDASRLPRWPRPRSARMELGEILAEIATLLDPD